MDPKNSASPFLPFGPPADRDYGSIRLFDETSDQTRVLPFKYSRFIVKPGQTSRLDQHQVLEAWVIVAGAGVLAVDGVESPVTCGDVVHFTPMRSHQVTNPGPHDLEVFSFWWSVG